MKFATLALMATAAIGLAGCETPSQKYGLAPLDPVVAYPNMNAIPPVERRTPNMRPLEVAEAEERLEIAAERAASIRPAQVAPITR